MDYTLNWHYLTNTTISVKFPGSFELGDWQTHCLGSHLPWSPQHFSSTVTAKSAVVFFPAGTRGSKQEKHMWRSPSFLAPAGRYLGFLTVPCILTLDPSVLSSSPCSRSLWKLWFPLLTGGRKGRKLQANLCSGSIGRLLTKGPQDRVCSGNIDNVRERMRRERDASRHLNTLSLLQLEECGLF